MTPTPKRRWFKFSLRMLFVVVTVICCWLGYELNWIRQRHEFVARSEMVEAEQLLLKFKLEPVFAVALANASRPAEAPGLLWLFGERGRSVVTAFAETRPQAPRQPGAPRPAIAIATESKELVQQAQRLFPEARIQKMEKREEGAPFIFFRTQ